MDNQQGKPPWLVPRLWRWMRSLHDAVRWVGRSWSIWDPSPENSPGPKRKLVFQPPFWGGYVSFREGIWLIWLFQELFVFWKLSGSKKEAVDSFLLLFKGVIFSCLTMVLMLVGFIWNNDKDFWKSVACLSSQVWRFFWLLWCIFLRNSQEASNLRI